MPILGDSRKVSERQERDIRARKPGSDTALSPYLERYCPGAPFRWRYLRVDAIDGFTLFEILVTVAILAVLASIAIAAYTGYTHNAKITNAINQIRSMSVIIDNYHEEFKTYPASLADVNLDTEKDPWGNPYHYLNIATASNNGQVRKDHNLVPLNTDYDLYSSGEDGKSMPPLTAAASRDDIVRANNGGFIGQGSDY